MNQDFKVQDSDEKEPGARIATGIRPATHSFIHEYMLNVGLLRGFKLGTPHWPSGTSRRSFPKGSAQEAFPRSLLASEFPLICSSVYHTTHKSSSCFSSETSRKAKVKSLENKKT